MNVYEPNNVKGGLINPPIRALSLPVGHFLVLAQMPPLVALVNREMQQIPAIRTTDFEIGQS